jgi:hypothetical protein
VSWATEEAMMADASPQDDDGKMTPARLDLLKF